MNTSLKTCTKAYARKLNSVTVNGITNDTKRLELVQDGIIKAVKDNVTSKTKNTALSGIIRSVVVANIRTAFGDEDYFVKEFNLKAPKTSKGSYSTIDQRWGFAVHKDGKAIVLDNTTNTWISRTAANIKACGLETWEANVGTDRTLITVQPDKPESVKAKGGKGGATNAKKRKVAFKAKAAAPKFVDTFTKSYVAKLEAAIQACAVNANGKYVTSKVFHANVATLVKSLDKALKVA